MLPRCALALLLVVGVAASAAIGAAGDDDETGGAAQLPVGHPSAVVTDERPSAVGADEQPSAVGADERPSAVGADELPSVDVAEEQPLDAGLADEQPLDDDERPEVNDPTTDSQPPPTMNDQTIADEAADVDETDVMEDREQRCAADAAAPPTSPAAAAPSPLVALSKASHEFAAQMYAQLSAEERGNIVFSPFSVHTALAMVLQGSPPNSSTYGQLSHALALKVGRAERYNAEYKRLLATYDEADSAVKVANRIYVGNGFKPRPDYLRVLDCKFQSTLKAVEFEKASVVAEVNNFIAEKTNGKIPKLLEAIDASTRMMIVNAIFFKSDWRYKFHESETRPEPFHVDSRRSFDHAEMMHAEISDFPPKTRENGATEYARLRTASADEIDAQVLELPYVDPKFRMKVFLPNQLDGIHLIDEMITRLPQIKLRWQPQSQLEVTLPKFAARKKSDLVKAFKGLGAIDMFSEQLADFHMISDEQLAVSKILHEAVLEVNEAGSEAAAATVVGLSTRLLTEPTRFRVNRPFVFVIEYGGDRSGHSIPLFMGRVVDPSADGARKLTPLTDEQRQRLRSSAAFATGVEAAPPSVTLAQTDRETPSVMKVVEHDGEEVASEEVERAFAEYLKALNDLKDLKDPRN